MTVTELINALKAQGITATAEQIEAELGDVAHISQDDIPAVAELLGAASSRAGSGGKARKSGKLARPNQAPKQTIQKIDPANLPQVASLQASQVSELIHQVEMLDDAEQDDRLAQFLTDLYARQQELTGFLVRAKSALIDGNGAMVAAAHDLNGAVEASMNGMIMAGAVLGQVAEGAPLGASFRARSGKFASFFNPTQPASEIEGAA